MRVVFLHQKETTAGKIHLAMLLVAVAGRQP
jgi:hypothetical protein